VQPTPSSAEERGLRDSSSAGEGAGGTVHRRRQMPLQQTAGDLKMLRVLILCALVILLEGFDLQAAGVSAMRVESAFKLTPQGKGNFLSSSAYGIFAAAALGGYLADKIGRKPVVVLGVALFGIFSISTLFAIGLKTLIAARILTGLGLGAAMPIVIAYASDHSPPHLKKRAVGFIYCAIPIGGLLAGVVMQMKAFGTSWKPVYLVGGIAPIIVAPILFLLLPQAPQKESTAIVRPQSNVTTGLFGERRLALTLFLWISTFGTLLVMYLLLNWLPSFIEAMKFTHSQSLTAMNIYNIGASIGAASGGYLLDRKLLYSTPIGSYVGSAVILTLFGFCSFGFNIVLVLAFCVGVTITVAQAILYAFAPLCYPSEVRNTGVGAAVAAGRLGTIVGPLLAGVLLGAGKSAANILAVMVPITLGSGILALLVVKMIAKPILSSPRTPTKLY
jgi:MFS transporter, AAHS family, 3-hydroxyphenylpropionic acid transporter